MSSQDSIVCPKCGKDGWADYDKDEMIARCNHCDYGYIWWCESKGNEKNTDIGTEVGSNIVRREGPWEKEDNGKEWRYCELETDGFSDQEIIPSWGWKSFERYTGFDPNIEHMVAWLSHEQCGFIFPCIYLNNRGRACHFKEDQFIFRNDVTGELMLAKDKDLRKDETIIF